MELKYLNKNQILVFRHIPKTAGTSINEFICKKIGFSNTNYNSKYYYNHNFGNIPSDMLENIKYLTGHLSSINVNSLDKDSISFTILRDPLARTMSHYQHLKKIINDNITIEDGVLGLDLVSDEIEERYKLEKVSVDNYFDNEFILYNSVTNLQSKYLDYEISDVYDKELKYDLLDESMLLRAEEYLFSLSFFGIQEEIEKTVLLLCYYCGFKPTRQFYRLNVSGSKDKIDSALKKKVSKYLKLDNQLYKTAKNIFYRKTKDLTYKKVLENYEGVMYATKRIESADEFDIRLVDFNDGWHSKEETHIWSGPSTVAEIDFSIATDMDISIEFEVIGNKSQVAVSDMEISVNYMPLNFNYNKENGKISFNIPSKVLKLNEQLTSIEIDVKNTNSVDGDTRKLGICVANFQIKKEPLNEY